MLKALTLALLLSGSLLSRNALALDSSNVWDGDYNSKSARRSDVVIGLSGGFLMGTAVGYPNELGKLANPSYKANAELGAGTSSTFWLGVAFNDYLSFGLGGTSFDLRGNGYAGNAAAFIFHAEAFPWFGFGRKARDFGLFAEFGAGNVTLKKAQQTAADGGFMSVVGAGAHYEGLRFGHFALGPAVAYRHFWSASALSHLFSLELRASFYTGP